MLNNKQTLFSGPGQFNICYLSGQTNIYVNLVNNKEIILIVNCYLVRFM